MLKDGTQMDLINILKENADDAYSQIENIDKKIMSNNVVKVSSLNFMEFLNMGQEYKDRFIRIMGNK